MAWGPFLCFDVPQINCLQLGAMANVTHSFTHSLTLSLLLAFLTLTVVPVCNGSLKACQVSLQDRRKRKNCLLVQSCWELSTTTPDKTYAITAILVYTCGMSVTSRNMPKKKRGKLEPELFLYSRPKRETFPNEKCLPLALENFFIDLSQVRVRV